MTEADEFLTDVRTLRRRARTDRHAHWLPLLFFGLATAGSAPLYAEHLERTGPDPADLYSVSADPRLGAYWTAVLLTGALLTVWWYRRHGDRTGIEGRTGPALVAATVAVVGYLALSALPGSWVLLWPLGVREFTPLLVLAAGLAALAWQERSRDLTATAAAFGAAAVLANTYDGGTLAYRLGWDVPLRLHQLPDLVLPAAVLLAGAAVSGVRARRSR